MSQSPARFEYLFPEWLAPVFGGILFFTFCGLIASDFKRIEIKADTLPPPPKDLTLSTLRLRSDPKSKVLDGITDPAEEIAKLRNQLNGAQKEINGLVDAVAEVSKRRANAQKAETDQLRADNERLQKTGDQLTQENARLTKDAKRSEMLVQFAKAREGRAEAKATNLAAASLVSSTPILRIHGSSIMGKNLLPKLADAFVKQGGLATFNIVVVNDNDAESDVAAGKADVCMTVFKLRDKTREQLWETTFLGNGGIAFVGFFTNGINGLTHEELSHLLDGTSQEWPPRKEGLKSVFLHLPGELESDESRKLLSCYFSGLKVGSNAKGYSEESRLCTILNQSNTTGKIAESDLFKKLKSPDAENLWVAAGAVFRTQDQPSTKYTFLTERFKILPIDDKFPGDPGYRYGFGLSLRSPRKAEGVLAAFLAFCLGPAGKKSLPRRASSLTRNLNS